MTKMPRDLWKRIVDSGFVAIVTLLSFLSFFVWRLLTSESDVKSHQKVQIGCFTSPSIRGISEKQSFLVYFQLGIIFWKKREGTSSVLFQWRPAFSALWRCGNSVVSVHHINNFWNTRSNLTKFSGQSPQWLRIVCAKLHVKRLRIDWDINEKRSADVVTTCRAVAAMAANGVCKITCKTVENWLRYQRKTPRRRCHNVGSVLCINNFWSTQSNSAKFTGQLP